MLAKNPNGQWDKTCTTCVVPFSVGEYTFWRKKQVLCITNPEALQCGVVMTITLIMSIQCNLATQLCGRWNNEIVINQNCRLAKCWQNRGEGSAAPKASWHWSVASLCLSLLCHIHHKLVQQNTFVPCINNVLLGGIRYSWHLYRSSGFWFFCLLSRQMFFAWPFFRFLQIQLKYRTCHIWLCTCLKNPFYLATICRCGEDLVF